MSSRKFALQDMKRSGTKICVVTCYDYPTASWGEEAGVDVVFVGDSLGTNILGYKRESEVTMDDMVHHLKAVRRGVRQAYLLVDMPFGSAESENAALENGLRLASFGADGIKLEGFKPEAVAALSARGLEVWAHLGLNPQIHENRNLQAKTAETAHELVVHAIELEKVGADFLVIEAVPDEVAEVVARKLRIPTIGIAASPHTDGQVLVITDLLGGNDLNLRHVKRYSESKAEGVQAIRSYVDDVKAGRFPSESHVAHMRVGELERFRQVLGEI